MSTIGQTAFHNTFSNYDASQIRRRIEESMNGACALLQYPLGIILYISIQRKSRILGEQSRNYLSLEGRPALKLGSLRQNRLLDKF